MADVRIHLYALCWNEVRLLPYFFRHYDAIVDRYFIFDNGSRDGSLELLRGHPRVTADHFEAKGPSFVRAAQQFYNRCWKASRGQADWVIVCNVDEHLHHADLRRYLRECLDQGISLIVPEGYEMICETFPTGDQPLHQQVRRGVRWRSMDKPEIFVPDRIDEINFAVGRHTADPQGQVRRPADVQVKLLHFKYLGLEYLSSRLSELRQGLREGDLAAGLGHKYLWDDQQKAEDFQRARQAAIEVLS
jgi:hypothetical protein